MMTDISPTSETSALAFGEKLLAILETGSFTTSYKYALLLTMFDATLEATGPEGQPPTVLHARDLGRRVFVLYWWQARPFGEEGALRQSGMRDLLVKIVEVRRELELPEHTSVDAARARHPGAVAAVERETIATVVRYPVVLLQRFGVGAGAVDDRFIYDVPGTTASAPRPCTRRVSTTGSTCGQEQAATLPPWLGWPGRLSSASGCGTWRVATAIRWTSCTSSPTSSVAGASRSRRCANRSSSCSPDAASTAIASAVRGTSTTSCRGHGSRTIDSTTSWSPTGAATTTSARPWRPSATSSAGGHAAVRVAPGTGDSRRSPDS
jgi:hypothetical protein